MSLSKKDRAELRKYSDPFDEVIEMLFLCCGDFYTQFYGSRAECEEYEQAHPRDDYRYMTEDIMRDNIFFELHNEYIDKWIAEYAINNILLEGG